MLRKNLLRPLPIKAKRVVVKVGSQLLVNNGELNTPFIRSLVKQLHELRKLDIQCALVSSGAIGCGRYALSPSKVSLTVPEKQAAAAIGQSRLMHAYDKLFSRHQIIPAQILLTREDLQDRQRYLNANHTLDCLLQNNILPIINENDTVSVDEIKFGDNDILASLISGLIHADVLVILSSTNGLMDPDHQRASQVNLDDPNIWSWVRPDKTHLGTGGMRSKLIAAQTLSQLGKYTIVADGNTPNVLLKIIKGHDVGTLFLPDPKSIGSKKHWLAVISKPHGEISIDAGAKQALLEQGKSLLASGITHVKSTFDKGDVVLITHNDKAVAKGVINYSAPEVEQILGKKTMDIEEILGQKTHDEVIHRNNLVLLLE